jgi:hypothetical protein
VRVRHPDLQIIPAEGVVLDQILASTDLIWPQWPSRQAYRKFDTAQMKTAWASRHQRRYALVEGPTWLASAIRYTLAGILDRRPVRICGIGAVCTNPAHRAGGHGRTLVEGLLDDAARDGAEMALLFSEADRTSDLRNSWQVMSPIAAELRVVESSRRGAPMTLIRGGEERDVSAVVAMGQVRASPFRFHLDRDKDFVQYVITTKRLLAGLGPTGARQLHFFIAEEGITAAAYVVVSIVGCMWTIEECGDRDPSGARVGAILQALVAREPAERRPTIRAWLPPGFLPPQVAIVSATPSTDVLMRSLGPSVIQPGLSGGDILYWRGDVF